MEDYQAKFERQQALEEESLRLTSARYRKERPLPWRSEVASKKEEAELPPGKRLLHKTVGDLAEAIEQFIAKAKSGSAGRHHSAVKYLEHISATQAAYLTARNAINAATRHCTLQTACRRVAYSIQDHIEFEMMWKNNRGLAIKLQRQLSRTNHARHRRTVISHVKTKFDLDKLDWSSDDLFRLGGKLLEIFCDVSGLCEIATVPAHKGHKYILQMTDKARDWLEIQHARCEILNPILLPMIIRPMEWMSPRRGGYIRQPRDHHLVKTRNQEYLDELETVDLSNVYDAVNTVQSVGWRINQKVLKIIKAVWDEGSSLGGLPSRNDLPLPPRPQDIANNEESRREWRHKAAAVHTQNVRLRSKRLAMSQKLWVAERYLSEEKMFFPHELDFRGRVYPANAFINPQADDSGKALIEFANGKALGPAGPWWLAIHIANLFGVDKVSYDERAQWVVDNEDKILDAAEQPLDGARFWATADSPYCALAACFEWAGYVEQGEDYVSHIPIALDGSNSGLQHFSAALRDEKGGRAVNLTPSEVPQDIYTEVAKTVENRIASSEDDEAEVWRGKVTRKIVKRPVMTYCYASTRYGMQKMIQAELDKLDADLTTSGKSPYLEGESNYDASMWLSHIVYEVIGEVVVAAQRVMDWLREVARITASVGLPVRWTTPQGFPVLQEYKHFTSNRTNVFWHGNRIRLMVFSEGTKINKRTQANGIAPNWVHSLDAAHLMATVNGCARAGVTDISVVHDSFGVHAADVPVLEDVLRETFIEQYRGDVLKDFRDEIAEQLPPELVDALPPVPEKGNLDLEKVRDSSFIFS